MDNAKVSMEIGNDGVAVIEISHPPVNALSFPVYSGIKDKLDKAASSDQVKALVLTGKGGKFSGGFDINRFQKPPRDGESVKPEVTLNVVVDMIEGSKKPVVAAIEGFALGGGLELAMSCHARIATPRAQLGLPELMLGIIPGAGGTQRLPRLVGLSKAIEMMMTSKPIHAEEGNKLGLIDSIVSSEELLKAARAWALGIAERRKPWTYSLYRTDRVGSLSDARKILKFARQEAKKIAPYLPHHICLDVIEEGIVLGGYNGAIMEVKVFTDLVSSDTSKALVHFFFSQRAASKVPNVTDIGLKPRNIKKVAVIGGGLMGSGIATALILSNINVILKEVDSEFLLKGKRLIEANVRGLVARGKLTQENADKALSLLKGVLDSTEFKDVDMVIEAVNENIPLKQKIFSEIEKACPPRCILATNTSSIDLRLVGEKTSSQDRIVGAHFFSPAHVMPLVEIVRTEETSPQVIVDLMATTKIMKKVPIVVRNCPAFAVNRIFYLYMRGAQLLANLGVDVFRIDGVIKKFGFPIGPFQLQDLIGYQLSFAIKKVVSSDSFHSRLFESPLIELLVKSGRNGKKNGRGYYIYETGSPPKPDPTVQPIIEESRRLTKIMPDGKPISVTDQEILEMMLFPAVNEACRVMEEGIVIRASDLDIASVLGMSFPSYRGGIVYWADQVGAKHIYSSLKKWYEIYGNFYKPSMFLEERAVKGMLLSAPALTSASKARL